MTNPTVPESIRKLATAGERAGFSIDQMILLLNTGLNVETLVSLIEWKLNRDTTRMTEGTTRWVC